MKTNQDFESFIKKVHKRAREDRKNGWKTASEMKRIKSETGIDFTNDYTRYHWGTYAERSPVQSYGTLEELDDLMYDTYQHQDPDWIDGPTLY